MVVAPVDKILCPCVRGVRQKFLRRRGDEGRVACSEAAGRSGSSLEEAPWQRRVTYYLCAPA